MAFTAPNFESSDIWSRPLDPRFLLDTWLWNPNWILRFSDGVRHSVSMLSNPVERNAFVNIAKILAIDEMKRGGNGRIRAIWWEDITDLSTQQRELN